MNHIGRYIAPLALIIATGCGGGPEPVTAKGGGGGGGGGKTGPVMAGGVEVKKEAADAFGAAVSDFKKHEEARDWDDASCNAVSGAFLAAGKAQGGKFPAAHYNAGVVILRCGREEQAGAEFELALSEKRDLAAGSSDPKVKNDPEFHQVWVQKALIRYRKGDVAGISEALQTILDKGFDPDGSQNVEAFVNLGMLYRERWSKDPTNKERTTKDKFNLEDDLARAQFWLQNALSINDAFMPAYNQLALYYLDKARAVGLKNAKGLKYGKEAKEIEEAKKKGLYKVKADLQTLELGLLVSEEASRRDANYAGVWNTQGLILLEMDRTGSATKAFKNATEKDPKFFEAWMNYAAINLAFRGYAEASKGYQAAMGIRAKDYDAKLGFAVATRGQLDFHLTTKQSMERKLSECTDPEKAGTPGCADANSKFPGQIKEHEAKFLSFYKGAIAAYNDAMAVDGGRPEAFFDKALLVEKYKQKSGEATTVVAYKEAEKLYLDVVSKFGGQPKYEKLVADSKSRAEEARKSWEFEEKAASAPPPPTIPPPTKASATPAPAASSAAPAPAAAPAASASAAPPKK
jgi:tetratricopeptide (TPR) repeat protein